MTRGKIFLLIRKSRLVPQVRSKAEFRGRPKGVRDSRPRKRPTQREQDTAWPLSLLLLAAPDPAATNAPATAEGSDAPHPTSTLQQPPLDSNSRLPPANDEGSAIDFLWSIACSQSAAAVISSAASSDGTDASTDSEFPSPGHCDGEPGHPGPALDANACGGNAGPILPGSPCPFDEDAWAAAADDELDPFGMIGEPW